MTPIALPSLPWREFELKPIDPASVNRMVGRRTERRAFGTPYWVARCHSDFLEPHQYGEADAFEMLSSSRGALVLAHDVFRPRPIEAGQAPLSWTPNLGSITNGGRTVTVSGVGPGFQFRRGDYVEFRMSALVRSLHRIVADAQANGSGTVTLSIMFALDTQHFSTQAAVSFEKPSTVMMIDPGSFSAPKGWGSRQVSFSMTEVFHYEAA